jgi:serine phosphatase RsbU (regulator of sigma subunit)
MPSVDPAGLQAILEINRKINSINDLRSVLLDISNSAAQLIDAEGASILLVDKETGNLHFEVAFSENAEALYDVVVPKNKGIAGSVAQTGEAIIVNDTQNDQRFYRGVDNETQIVTRSLIAVPLVRHEEVIGVMEVINSNKPVGFTNDDRDLLNEFGVQAGIAISNALLYKGIQEKADELEYLFEISNLTNQTYERKDLFAKIIELLSSAFDSGRVSIMLVDEQTGKLYVESAIGIDENLMSKINVDLNTDRISSMAVSMGKIIFSNDIERSGYGRNKKLRYDNPAFISVPIKTKNIPIGVINISEPKKGIRYTGSMIKTLQTIANQVGSAYESNKNYIERIEHEKLTKELDIMRMLQNSLLMSNFKAYKNISIYARMKSAEIVGGDFYDFYELPPNKLGFVIGDVSGKGLPASLFMAISRSVIKAYSYYTQDPHELLEYANNMLVEDSHVGMFATLFYGIIDMDTMEMIYSNAGHNQQYLYRPGENQFILLGTRGIPLGISMSESYETRKIQLKSGDVMFTFTDGVTEAVNDAGQEFELDRLKHVVKQYASTNSATLVNSIIRSVDEWANGVAQWDDMTVLSIRIA